MIRYKIILYKYFNDEVEKYNFAICKKKEQLEALERELEDYAEIKDLELYKVDGSTSEGELESLMEDLPTALFYTVITTK